MLHVFQGCKYFCGGGAALLAPLPATGTALSSLSRTATSPGDRFSLEKEQPGSGKCWHTGLSWLAAGRRSRVPCSQAQKFVDVFLSHPDGGGCAVGKQLSRHPRGAKRGFLPQCPPRGCRVTPALTAGCVCNASNNDPASAGPSPAPAALGEVEAGDATSHSEPHRVKPSFPNAPTAGEQLPLLLIQRGHVEVCATRDICIFHPKFCLSMHKPFPVPSPLWFAALLQSKIWPQL